MCKFKIINDFSKTNYSITPTRSSICNIKQGGKVRRPVHDFSTVDKKNADYADKLSHLKA